MITLMGLRITRLKLCAAMLVTSLGALVAWAIPESGLLSKATRVGSANLETAQGQPVTVDYYNLQGNLKAVAYKLAQERPKTKGWKQSGSDEFAVFTSSKRTGDIMWQRIAVFRGKLDKTFQVVPKTEKAWLNVIVYRVRSVRVFKG
ncbi:MAG: hypothetical protein WAO58_08565 [Fimbriimonadaceae bacterium]